MNCDVERTPGITKSAHEVAPPGLQDPARDRVEQDVEPEDLAVEGLAPVGPLEDQEDQECVGREVDLGGVEGTFSGVPTASLAKGSVNVTPSGPWVSLP